jgi:hypothetical protein
MASVGQAFQPDTSRQAVQSQAGSLTYFLAFSAAFMFSTNSIRKLKEKRWQGGEAGEGLPKRKS